MSLSAWEQRALHSIESRLAGSDPELSTLLVTFTELACDEEMPAAEKVTPSWLAFRRPSRKFRRLHRGWANVGYRRLNVRWAMLLLLTSIALITIALAVTMNITSTSTSQEVCTTPWIASCASPAPAGSPGAATHSTPSAHAS